MKRLILCLAWLLLICAVSAWSQSLYVFPIGPLSVPRGTTQTAQAVVVGVGNKGITWTTDHGTLVGLNPCTSNEGCVIGLLDNTAETDHLTATTTVGSVAQTVAITFTASPTIATGHPRLMVTPAIVSAIQAKTANASTYPYTQSASVAASRLTADQALGTFSTWSGSACTGGSWPTADQSGNGNIVPDAWWFAFMAQNAPTSTLRNQYGCPSRDMWTYIMTKTITSGNSLYTTMRTDGNYWSDNALQLIVTGDELMGGGYMSSSDITLQRQFNAYMLQLVLNLLGGYGFTPPVAAYNNPTTQFTSTGPSFAPNSLANTRAMGNNYSYSRAMYLIGLGLMFDDNTTDDPPLSNTCSATRYQLCSDFSGGSMHAYVGGSGNIGYFFGSILYLTYANLEDPNVTQQAYNAAYSNVGSIPACQIVFGQAYPCFGSGKGGESVEGSYYGYAQEKLRWALNMLYTTGYNDPLLYGPQISLETSSWWDMKLVVDNEFLTGFAQSNGGVGAGQPSYSFMTTGDTLTYNQTPASYVPAAAIATFDSYTGRTDRTALELWPMMNSPNGGPYGTNGSCVFYCGFDFGYNIVDNNLQTDLLISLPAGDPLGSLPSDPRPSLPTDLYNGSLNYHQMLRPGWTGGNANSFFSYWSSQGLINHEDITSGAFSVFWNNEYITKPRVVFNDYNTQMSVASQSNEMQVVPPVGSGASSAWQYVPQGGEWFQGQQNGLPSLLHSELPTYAADIVNNTADYNGWQCFNSPYDTPCYNAIASASRSLIYLRGTNQIVYADRAATTGATTPMSTNLTITGTPTIGGATASWPTRSTTQKGCFTSVTGGTLTAPGLISGSSDQAGDWEPASVINLSVGTVSSAFMVNLLTWGASSLTCPSAGAVSSSSGQAFSGTVQGDNLVLFSQTYPLTFTGTTFPASSALAIYLADLTPNTSYPITGAGTPSTATSDTAGVLEFPASGTGSITVGSSTPQAAQPTFSPAAGPVSNPTVVTASTSTSGCGSYIYFDTNPTPVTLQTTYTVTTAVTLYAYVHGCPSYSDSTVGPASYTITAAVSGVVQSGGVSSGVVTQ